MSGFKAQLATKTTHEGEGGHERCITSWVMRISGPHIAAKSVEVRSREDKPSDNEWGYEKSFDLIAWSKDGSRLLTAAVLAGGDWDETTPIIFDFKTEKVSTVELAPFFRKIVPGGCLISYRPVGFDSRGELVILATPLDERCFTSSLWALDYENETMLAHKIGNVK